MPNGILRTKYTLSAKKADKGKVHTRSPVNVAFMWRQDDMSLSRFVILQGLELLNIMENHGLCQLLQNRELRTARSKSFYDNQMFK